MTTTITMNGYSTGYGASTGSEAFVLNGYSNTVLLAGANESVAIAGGGLDSVDLNSTGFTNTVSDVIDLGQSVFDSVVASHALTGATLLIENGVGVENVSLVNHGGSTTIDLGNTGNVVNQSGLSVNDVVQLNGDASNNVTLTGGGGAEVSIGAANDGFLNYGATVALAGLYNVVSGGDEAFTVTDAAGLNQVTLGNGRNTVTLGGDQNSVSVGNGANDISFSGLHNSLTAGTGSNDVSSTQGWLHAAFAAGGAGSTDSVSFSGGRNIVTGGSENFTVDGGRTGSGIVRLGDGNDQVSLASGYVTLGSSTANTAQDSVSVVRGGGNVTLNGGVDQVTLSDTKQGYDKVQLNGTLLGTTLSAAGSFDSITLTADANAAITETAVNGGLSLVIDGDKTGGIGDISVSGLSQDDLAHITLVGLGAYTVTTDDTPVGGLTLHFAHGSIDLIGLQAISNHLITG